MEDEEMIRNVFAVILCFFLTSCFTMPSPNPVFVNQIDSYFNNTKTHTYKASGKFKRPIPYKVGQYVVTGMSSPSGRSVSKMAIVGKEKGGWIIETHSLTQSSESIMQMLVLGMEKVYETGTIDDLEIIWVKIKPHGETVQTIEGPMLALTKGLYKKGLAGLEVQTAMSTESGTVSVPAGNFKGTLKASSEVSFLGKKYLSDAWFHPSVPINGMVKSVSKNGDTIIELLDFGLSGASRSF
jgi:hypothetical protein